ncbi:ankyrin repeat domain-containing protein [Seonamhaeicola sp.]|uniref:ankyrin repeat domain-containing protein n=1 Tax=Seonamhaeicola sp. TaxID=1912245 RepID=UPI002633C35B|nr:ankyrin repeat domain-containing protein [Seonamhaeicola sp.]
MKSTLLSLAFFISMLAYCQNNIFDICRSGNVHDIEKVFNEDPSMINAKNDAGYTPLILACYHGNESIVKFLLDKNCDVNSNSDNGTPLMAAVVKQNLNITNMLLEKKADPNIADTNGTTALHYATLFKQNEIAELLVRAGANYDLKDGNGKSAYDYALINNNKELLSLFKN